MATKESVLLYDSRGYLDFKPQNNSSLDLIFPTTNRGYVNEHRLYYHLFNEIPCRIVESKIMADLAHQHFLDTFSKSIQTKYYQKTCFGKETNAQLDDCIYVLKNKVMVYFDIQSSIIRYLFNIAQEQFVFGLIEQFEIFKILESKKPEIYLLTTSNHGFDTQRFELPKTDINLEKQYNDDLLEVNKTICKRLNTQHDKGLLLLHGEPGTGKTSYLRYLTTRIKKKMIFFPPNLADGITNPQLISILIDNPNSILIIEDAENILIDRNYNDKTSVSALLNLSDGLLSDCLNIQIICTFNTDIAKIDSALLRKGRLIASYKFEPLATEKAQQLSDDLGYNQHFSAPTRLTDIYNQEEKSYQQEKPVKIGF